LDIEFGDAEGISIQPVRRHRLASKNRLFIDIVNSDPWLLLRVPQEPFEFAATGLPNFASRRENLAALAAALPSRASGAPLGPGMKWIESNAPPSEQRVASQAVYNGFLRWQLTQLFLQCDIQGDQA